MARVIAVCIGILAALVRVKESLAIIVSSILNANIENRTPAVWYIDNTLTTGENTGVDQSNAFRSIQYFVERTQGKRVDIIEFVPRSGPYAEVFSTSTTPYVNDISFHANDRTIRSNTTNFVAAGFLVNDIIRVSGTQHNNRQYTIAAVATNMLMCVASNVLHEEDARGRDVKLVNMLRGVIGAFNMVHNGTPERPITWRFNFVELDCGVALNEANGFEWHPSLVKDGEWYVTAEGGSNPSLMRVWSGTQDGQFVCDSADNTPDIGVVGSLTEMSPWGWGDIDQLGFDTCYIKSVVSPSLRNIKVGQTILGINSFRSYQILENGIISYPTRTNFTTGGIGVRNIGQTQWILNGMFIRWATTHGVDGGPIRCNACLTYWCGHRGYAFGTHHVFEVYNCVDYGSHLFLFVSSSATGQIIMKNCICQENEAGAIDKKPALTVESTLIEDYNIWFPKFGANGAKLAYTNPTAWPVTGANDYPPNAVTTISTQEALLNAGGANPLFVAPSNVQVHIEDFRLQRTSVGVYSGQYLGAMRDITRMEYSDPPSRGIFNEPQR